MNALPSPLSPVLPHPTPTPGARAPATASICVVIPAYRAARTIGCAVRSVLAQTRPADEIVVVDDGSPDDLAAALAPFGGQVTLVRKPNGGAASARNAGIARSTSDLIAFLDADDYWEPRKLERQVAALDAHPEVGLVAGAWFNQPPGGERVSELARTRPWFGRVLRLGGERAFELALRTWTCTVLVRRTALGDLRFVPGLEPAEDRDLWFRLILRTPTYVVGEALATAVLEPNSLSRSGAVSGYEPMVRVIRRHAEHLGRRALRAHEAAQYRAWAAVHLGHGEHRQAIAPASRRLLRQPFSAEAWYVLAKSLAGSVRG